MPTELNDPLRNLMERMNTRLTDFQQRPPSFGQADLLAKQVEELQRRYQDKGTARPTRNFLHEALDLVHRQGPRQALTTHLRYVCWALLEPWGQPPRRLLDTTQLFPATLAELEKLCDQPVFRPLAWRGLLEAYFQYSPPADARMSQENWRLLREFLARELPSLSQRLIQRSRLMPPWLQMIGEHMNLLGDNPCARYAPAVLAKDEGDIQRLRDDLRIPEQSWFWSELLLSQVRRVIELEDNAFWAILDDLLEKLREHPSILDKGLALLLERYARSPFRNRLHTGLRDTAIGAWGSPHFQRNARWGLVESDTKQMVQQWLVIRALTDFFRLLQEDRAADERRLNFWLRYRQSIDYFHFALGPDVYESQQADYVATRKMFREHICRLISSGQSHNNAFILQIGDYFFVEFGAVGNASYAYRKEAVPFGLNQSELHRDTDLKVTSRAILRLIHRGDWEPKFEQELARLGIYPDQPPPPKPKIKLAANPHPAAPALSADTGHDPCRVAISLALRAGVNHEDLRRQGGALWISHHRQIGDLASRLRLLGFRYHEGRGWWRK